MSELLLHRPQRAARAKPPAGWAGKVRTQGPGPVDLANAVNWEHPLNWGRVLWLYTPDSVGGGAGNRWNDLVGKNHGTLVNGPAWVPGSPGYPGQSLGFDGADDYVQVTPQPVAGSSAQSAAAWVYLPATPTAFRYCLTRGNRAANWSAGVSTTSTGTSQVAVIAGDIQHNATGLTTLTAGWHLLGFDWAPGGPVRVWADGRLDGASGNTTGNLRSDAVGWLWGHSYTASEFWLGRIGEGWVYNRLLSAGEWAEAYRQAVLGHPDTLLRTSSRRNRGFAYIQASSTPVAAYTPVRRGQGPVDLANAIDWEHPLNRGKVLWLYTPDSVGGGAGNRWNDLAGRNHGTLTNGPAWVPGPYGVGRGLSFDGTDDYVDIPSSVPWTSNGVVSVHADVTPSSLAGNHTIVSWGKLLLRVTSAGVQFWADDDGGSFSASFAFVAGRQYSIGVRQGPGTACEIFVDGVSIGSGTGSSLLATSRASSVGRYARTNSWFFAGRIHEVTFALTAAPNWCPQSHRQTRLGHPDTLLRTSSRRNRGFAYVSSPSAPSVIAYVPKHRGENFGPGTVDVANGLIRENVFGDGRVLWLRQPPGTGAGGGRWNDLSGNGNHCQLVGSPVWQTPPRGDGTRPYPKDPHPNFGSSGSNYGLVSRRLATPQRITIGCWFRTLGHTLGGSGDFILLHKGDGATNTDSSYFLGAYTSTLSGRLGFWVSTGSAWVQADSGVLAEYKNGSWYRVLATFNGTHANIYVDGVHKGSAATGTITVPSTPTRDWEIGYYPGLTTLRAWGGIADFFIADRAYTDGEIEADYAQACVQYPEFLRTASARSRGALAYVSPAVVAGHAPRLRGRNPGPVDLANALDRTHPANDDRVLWLYSPDGAGAGGGRWNDLVGRNHGTLVNNPRWVPGPYGVGRGVEFTAASSQYVDTPLTNLAGSGTVAWWTRPSLPHNDGTIHGWWGQITALNTPPEFSAQKSSDGNIYIGWNRSGADHRIVLAASAANYTQNVWQRYVLTWANGGATTLYRNGVALAANGGTTTTSDIGQAFRIGQQGHQLTYFTGGMADFVIASRAWSPAEVAADYRRALQGHPDLLHNSSVRRRGLVYALAPVADATVESYTLTAEPGSYSVSGVDATLTYSGSGGGGLTLAAEAGSYALTGTAADLLHGRVVVPDAGSYALTGSAAALLKTSLLTAEAGTYAVTGTDADLLRGYPLAANQGSYTLTGTDASLLRGYPLTAEAGSYSLTGTDAGLFYGRELAADGGVYVLTGTAAGLVHARILSADAGSYSLSGTDAALNYSGSGDKTLTAEAGGYSLAGTAANLVHAYVLAADAGSYSLTGAAALLLRGYPLAAATGSYTLGGVAASLTAARLLSGEPGGYALGGSAAELRLGYSMTAGGGSYALTGVDAGSVRHRVLAADTGAYAVSGTEAALTYSPLFSACWASGPTVVVGSGVF